MKQLMLKIIADFHESSIPDLIERELKIPLEIEKIITVIGPRRAGKTYFLFQIMKNLLEKGISKKHVLYVNFEDERFDFHNNYDVILESYLSLYPEINLSDVHIFFDEIQELPGWEKFVRRLYEQTTKHIFISGSNSKFLSTEIATSLRGRCITIELLPLSFSEYLKFLKIKTTQIHSTKKQAQIANAFENYIFWGGYPEIVNIELPYKREILQEYFNVMIYRDIIERYQIGNVALLKYVLKRLLSSFSKEYSANKIHNELKSKGFSIGKDGLYQLLDHILSVYMVTYIEKYDPSVVRREMMNRKIYTFDNGLITANRVTLNEDRGKLLENIVFQHLRRKKFEIYFLKNGWECDFIFINDKNQIGLIQVVDELNIDNVERKIKGLKSSSKIVNAEKQFLIYNSKAPIIRISEQIQSMPVWEWLLS